MSFIILAAGGTGGHIFPALSVAKKLQECGKKVILFTDSKFQLYSNNKTNIELLILPIKSKRNTIINKINFYISLIHSYFISFIKVMKLKPTLVIGFGGYTSFPTLLAANHLSVNIILHEQNIVIGKVNRFFIKHAKILATCFPRIRYLNAKYFHKCIMTGNPTVQEIITTEYNYDINNHINILIIGGSQGADVLNTIICSAIISLPHDIRKKLFIMQQCTKNNINTVQKQYEENNVKAEISSFFTDNIYKISKAHLVISRAGATSIAEITRSTKPAIYIPYRYSSDNHQLYNAQYMVKMGAALLMEEQNLTISSIRDLVTNLLTNTTQLYQMAQNAKKIAFLNEENNFYTLIKKNNYFT